MKRVFPIAIVCLLLAQSNAHSQSADPLPRYEVAGEFTSLGRNAFTGLETQAGFGGRFTFNLNEMFALEAAGYFFPDKCFVCRENGRMTEAVAGVKVGKRFDKWGIFAKARPGIVSFSEGAVDVSLSPSTQPFPIVIEQKRVTTFAADVGGVLEFYPTKRIVTRFDAGDTIIHFNKRRQNGVISDGTGGFQLFSFTQPARTEHQFQFNASVGFRF